jgi:cell division protein FtsN
MAKDYKDAGKKPAKSGGSKGTPGYIWMIGGFAMGVIATVVTRVGVINPQAQQQIDAARAAAEAPVAAAPEEQKPKYDFYNMLPKFEVVVPETEKVVNGTTPGVTPPGTYVLQAGSFRTAADADRLRAQLALVGIEARIEQVTIDAKDTWHRVRIGPLKEGEELERIKARLAENKLTALVIRVGD